MAARVLKRDAAGRVHTTVEQRQAVLAEFERSGLSGPQFARVAGVAYQTFASWRQKQRKGALAERSRSAVVRRHVEPVAPRLVEAVVAGMPAPLEPGAGAAGALEVLLPGGAKALVASADQAALAAQLIKVLARSC